MEQMLWKNVKANITSVKRRSEDAMKMITVLFSFVLMLSMLVGCTTVNHTGVDEFTFQAKILQIDGNTVTVEPLEGEDILRSSDRITFSKSELDDISVSVGDIVNILYIGGVRESYPAQITARSWSFMSKSYATYEPTAPFGDGPGALLDGILRQKDGCLIVEIKDSSQADGSEVLPIFPANVTAWDEAASALIVNGIAYPLDSFVSFGGGYITNFSEDYTIPESYSDPEEAFIVSNTGSWLGAHAPVGESSPTSPNNPSLLSSWKPLTDLPSDYGKEQAVADGVYVNIHGAEIVNQALVDTFYRGALHGIAAFMRTMEYTVEGDPIITDFQYDGAIFTVTTDISRDKFKGIESEDIYTVTYKYLIPYDHSRPFGSLLSCYLSNEENIFKSTIVNGESALIDGLGRIPSPSNDVMIE
jgi:hypothetical protein